MPDQTSTLASPDDAIQAPDAPAPDHAPPDHTRHLRARAARRDMAERRRVAARLRQALAQNEFLLYYQPFQHLKSGIIRGAEAVIRLQHRRRGLIMPHHFMPIAERFDVVNDIGAWLLLNACQNAATWPSATCVAIRLTHRQLRSGKLAKQLIDALTISGLPASRLELGLTEPMLIDRDDDTIFAIRAVAGLGVRMAIDDFGAGYASLAALKRLPLTTLKLDRGLVQRLGQDHGDTAITHAAVEAGHAMGCSVLADGVETKEQYRLLEDIGCDSGQGPFISPPLTATQFLARL
jgi:EAL domain-containing protein (putative c-di-GMP-specific phosphodiesterase class I)